MPRTSAPTHLVIRPSMFVLMGPPGCGKSTWCAQQQARSQLATTVISMDDHYEAYARTHSLNYKQAWDAVNATDAAGVSLRDGLEAQLDRTCADAVAQGNDVVIDRTNMAKADRARWLNKLVEVDYRKVGVVFDVPEAVAKQRAEARSRVSHKAIPDFVYGLKATAWEPPTVPDEFEVLLHIRADQDARAGSQRAAA